MPRDSKLRDQATLLDLQRAVELALSFVAGVSRAAFDSDLKTQSAVLHQILIMGEAVKRLSADIRARHADVPWAQISGMRDRLIHGYDDVDLDQVWLVLERDLPELKKQLMRMVTGFGDGQAKR